MMAWGEVSGTADLQEHPFQPVFDPCIVGDANIEVKTLVPVQDGEICGRCIDKCQDFLFTEGKAEPELLFPGMAFQGIEDRYSKGYPAGISVEQD